jgi:small-conductance mechanosensitive channel
MNEAVIQKEGEHIASMGWHEILNSIVDVLSYHLFDIDGSPVSLAKLLTGIFLLVIGYMLSTRLTNAFDRRFLSRLSLEESLRYTFRRLFFYVLLFFVTVFTLRTLNVPITIFTVIGGALAVGIGFGSQNLVNNFISGVLVMVERPIRVGDFIEVTGVSGTVQTIGIRSTEIRTPSNVVTIVPNTFLIQNNLSNWSMSPTLNLSYRYPVFYSADLRHVARLCVIAAESVPEVLKSPAPYMVVAGYADSGLTVDIYYSISSYQIEQRARIESDMRIKLNELFYENKVPFNYNVLQTPPFKT